MVDASKEQKQTNKIIVYSAIQTSSLKNEKKKYIGRNEGLRARSGR